MPPSSKQVLAIYYSQSGQTQEILESLLGALKQAQDVNLVVHRIEAPKRYPFPWTSATFFDAMPESVLEVPCALLPLEPDLIRAWDLVILAHQPWFLSPSIPVSAFLQSSDAKRLLDHVPIITVIGCRNMWVSAQDSVKRHLQRLGAVLIGNIVLRDTAPNLVSVLTIMHWVFTGRRDRLLGCFPKPGVSDRHIAEAGRFGAAILEHLRQDAQSGVSLPLQPRLLELGAVRIDLPLVSIEKRGRRIFQLWAEFIAARGGPGDPKRRMRVVAFKYYLIAVIFIVSPIAQALAWIVTCMQPAKSRANAKRLSSVSSPTKMPRA